MNGMTDTYTTPEGFELHKPLLFPEVTDFTELLHVDGAWDFETMNHRNGYAQPATPKEITREGWGKVVGRFCSVRIPGHRGHLVVTPTDQLLDLIYADESESLNFAFFDRVGFEAIYHESTDRVLIVASASGIIASRYLAYVDPTTVPTGEGVGG